MDNRRQRTNATQARVLDAAVTVLNTVGVERLSLQAVADAADVALRTVYNHFPSKEALLVEAYDQMVAPWVDAVAALPEDGTPSERLQRFVVLVYERYEQLRGGMGAVLGVTGIDELDARIAEVRALRRGELTKILRPAARSGQLKVPLKQAVAVAFLWTTFATYASLVDASDLSHDVATRLALASLDAALFGYMP
jgi:AcrR family transcriptional regulator